MAFMHKARCGPPRACSWVNQLMRQCVTQYEEEPGEEQEGREAQILALFRLARFWAVCLAAKLLHPRHKVVGVAETGMLFTKSFFFPGLILLALVSNTGSPNTEKPVLHVWL